MKYIVTFLIVNIAMLFSLNLDSINNLFLEKQYLDAEKAIQKMIIDDIPDASIFEMASKISLKLDDLTSANKYINKAIELDPNNDILRLFWDNLNLMRSSLSEAQKNFDSGFIDESIESYNEITNLYPDFALAFYNFGMIYYRIEDYSNSANNLNQASSLNPFESKYQKAIINIAAKLTQKGNEEYRRLEYDTALSYYNKAVDFYPGYSEARFKSALIMNKIDDFNSAKILLLENIKYDNKHLQSYKLLGDMYNKLSLIDSAIYYYENAVKINNNYYKGHYALGKAYFNIANYDKAEIAFVNAVTVNNSYSKAYESLGSIYTIKERPELAIQNYDLAIQNDKKNYQAYSKIASSFNSLKKYKKAKDASTQSIDIKSKNASAYYELGVAEKGLGNIVAAKSAFKNASKDKKWRKIAKYELTLIEKGM